MSLTSRVPEVIELAQPASSNDVQNLAARLALQLPVEYEQLLGESDGVFANKVQIYSCQTVPERNETYEVATYAPGFILIASVNSFPVLLRAGRTSPVFQGGWGHMDPNYFVMLAPSLAEWIDMGCPDRDDINE